MTDTDATSCPDLLAHHVCERGQMTVDQIRQVLVEALVQPGRADLTDKRVLVIIPDGTRTAPIPALFELLAELLGPRTAALDYLVALGTHLAMTDRALSGLVGAEVKAGQAGRSRIFNHAWDREDTFVTLGTLSAGQVEALSEGRMSLEIPVKLNKLVMDYDQLIVCGPVFPHEVVGFSGGNKYFFPGIGGPEMINVTHWLGALLTNMATIGRADTPMRQMIDHAADMIPTPRINLAMVLHGQSLVGLYAGTMKSAWRAAVDLSARLDVIEVDEAYRRVLAVMPEMYDDLWTGGKGMYKLEPVVADGGEVVIYAPHITEVSYVHGKILDQIGYHVRDYFLAQWDRFRH